MNCNQCGSPLEPGVKFCGYCGAATPDDPASDAVPSSLEDMPTKVVQEPPTSAFEWTLMWEGDEPMILVDRVVLGRGADSDIKLDDTEASRQHALIEKKGVGYTLTDKGSTNGTFLNDERISGSVLLKGGDEIRIGTTIFTVKVTGGEPSAPVCPSCGSGTTEEMTFCGSCGHPLTADSLQADPTPAPAISAIPESIVEDQADLAELHPPKFKLPRRGLLIGCGVIILLGIVAACCGLTVSGELFEFLEELFDEIRYLF
jgi:hypothetical protein